MIENVLYNFVSVIQGYQPDIILTQADSLRTNADFGCKNLESLIGWFYICSENYDMHYSMPIVHREKFSWGISGKVWEIH